MRRRRRGSPRRPSRGLCFMRYPRKSMFAVFLLFLCVPLACAQLTFTTIDVPGAATTSIGGINSSGDVGGSYSTTTNGPAHAFLLKGGNFTFFDYPGAPSTFATGINDSGLIVGFTSGGTRELGFTYDGTTFTPIRAG